jgi:transglutaminase superfamily protein
MKERKTMRVAQPTVSLVLLGAIALGVLFKITSERAAVKGPPSLAQASASNASPQDLAALLALPPARFAELDIAFINLLCAERLPTGESLDVSNPLASLDDWSKRVQSETQRHFYKLQKNPAEFNHSEGYFRMLTLITVLQQDFGVRYNLERAQQPDYSKADDLFLTGVLGKRRQGTCVSLPVLYVAVGRRLGYPLKLVTTKAHVFARRGEKVFWSRLPERLRLAGSA